MTWWVLLVAICKSDWLMQPRLLPILLIMLDEHLYAK
jgi:hypothetical protein